METPGPLSRRSQYIEGPPRDGLRRTQTGGGRPLHILGSTFYMKSPTIPRLTSTQYIKSWTQYMKSSALHIKSRAKYIESSTLYIETPTLYIETPGEDRHA